MKSLSLHMKITVAASMALVSYFVSYQVLWHRFTQTVWVMGKDDCRPWKIERSLLRVGDWQRPNKFLVTLYSPMNYLFVTRPNQALAKEERPNKAPEPTPRAVTPRATEGASK